MSRYSNEDLEEERRLCYVGITRATKELYLSCANSRMLFGQTQHNRPSRFLEEIDSSLVEVEQSPAAAQTKAMRQRYMQQQNAYLQDVYKRQALEAPLRQIAANAGLEGSVIIDKIMSGSDANYGFDAQKEVCLLYTSGLTMWSFCKSGSCISPEKEGECSAQ